jgi:hypothetical protein
MDRDLAEVIWLFDVEAEVSGPVVCRIDELPTVVDQALASVQCAGVAVDGVVSQVEFEGEATVRFDLVAYVDGSRASCRVRVASGTDASVARAGTRVRVWGRLGVDESGRLEVEARDVQLKAGP